MRRKSRKYLWLLLLLLVVTIGYALVSTTLKITGNATVTKQTWNVYWDTPVVTEGSVTTPPPTRSADSGDPANTKLTWSTTLSLPGDYYEFTVDAVNAGSIDAMITGLNPTVSPALPANPDYIKYSVTYDDGVIPELNHLLAKKSGNTPTTEKYKVRVYYDEAAATATTINSMTGNTTYTFTLNITYGQATDEAIDTYAWKLPSGKTADTLTLGDEICMRAECFNFIRYDNDDVVMLAKYNLKVGNIIDGQSGNIIGRYASSDPGYNKQSSEARGYVRDASTWNATMPFSATNYWNDNGSPKSDYPGSYYPGPDYPTVYDAINYKTEPDFSTICDNSTNCWKTPGYSVAYYVDAYKTILINAGTIIKDARLLTYAEATDSSIGCDISTLKCPTTGASSFVTNTSFWFGSASYTQHIWDVQSTGALSGYRFDYDNRWGVRPVIVVEKSNL